MKARAHTAAGLVIVVAAALQTCSYPAEDPQTKCEVESVTALWNQAGLYQQNYLPATCPIRTGAGVAPLIRFAGIIEGDPAYVARNGETLNMNLALRVYSAAPGGSTLANASGSPAFFFFFGSPPRADAYVDYYAATYPIPAGQTKSADIGVATVILKTSEQANAKTRLSYTHEIGAALNGPTSVALNSSFTLTSSMTNYTNPVTKKWYRNNTLVATGPSSFTDSRGTGTYTYRLELTDAEGDRGVASKTVIVGTGGGSGGGNPPPPCNPGGGTPIPLRTGPYDAPGSGPQAERPAGDPTPVFQQQLPPCP